MKTIKWNGEFWYVDRRSVWLRLRSWVIWVGGWEDGAAGGGHRWRLHTSGSGKNYRMGPTPLSLLGHRVTFLGWGLQIQLRHGYFTWVWHPYRWRGQRWGRGYISRDGTPNHAHHWLWGYSTRLEQHATKRGRERDVD
jgi:hypothetical protein